MQDLESALSFMFRREIVIKKIIRKARLEALEEFVDLLVQVRQVMGGACIQLGEAWNFKLHFIESIDINI